MKALFGLWSSFKVAQINRLLRPHNVRLVLKKSKDWGQQVSLTAHLIKGPVVVADYASVLAGAPKDMRNAARDGSFDVGGAPASGVIIGVGDLGVQRAP